MRMRMGKGREREEREGDVLTEKDSSLALFTS
jgi:hypothetical protein